jgi:hypothetical protein
MREAGIGRILVASLHQAIADILPMRLAFYENWLNAEGLRDGTIGLAPLYAVLSFLRQEGEAYYRIATRAGEYAADWSVQGMSPFRRGLITASPRWLRTRLVLGAGGRLVRSSYRRSRLVWRVRRGTAYLDVRESPFCNVREPVAEHLCGFYASALSRLLSLFGLDAQAAVIACRGTGQAACLLEIPLSVRSTAP